MFRAKRAGLLAELCELVAMTVRSSPERLVQDRITDAARMLGLPRSRVEDWYYREVRRVEPWEADTIRANWLRSRETEIRRTERRLDQLRAELAQMDPLGGIRPAAVPRRAVRPRHRRGGAQPA